MRTTSDDTSRNPDTVDRYRGDAGRDYYDGRFGDHMEIGRRYQSKYFQPVAGADRVVCDFGCGDGTILRELPAARRLGIEVNPACWDRIKARNEHLDVPVEVFEKPEDVPSECADAVVSNHCLEHVPSPLDSLRELRRILKPGGNLALVVPYDDWRAGKNHSWRAQDPDFHLFTWSPMNLGNLLLEAGFEVQEVEIKSFAWSPRIFWVHRTFGRAAFELAGTLLSRLRQRREVCARAVAPKS